MWNNTYVISYVNDNLATANIYVVITAVFLG